MKTSIRPVIAPIVLFVVADFGHGGPAVAQATFGTITASQVGFDQRLGEQVPLDLVSVTRPARRSVWATYFGRRPVILALVYYRCPLLCNQVLTA